MFSTGYLPQIHLKYMKDPATHTNQTPESGYFVVLSGSRGSKKKTVAYGFTAYLAPAKPFSRLT